jgi:Domain of unknown function (DUF4365)
MPQRPRPHELKDEAHVNLHSIFSKVAWTLQELVNDYGEDFLVRIFENGVTTPWHFFVQSKATDHIAKWLSKDGALIRVRVDVDHVRHWQQLWQPVVLTVFDSRTETTYWQIVQSLLVDVNRESGQRVPKTIALPVPTANRLDAAGLRRLRNLAKQWFQCFDSQRVGAKVLVERVRQQWGVTLTYDPEGGCLMLPKGTFLPDSSGGGILCTFGHYSARLKALERKSGIASGVLIHESVKVLQAAHEAFASGNSFSFPNPDGSTVVFLTWAEFLNHVLRNAEEEDA